MTNRRFRIFSTIVVLVLLIQGCKKYESTSTAEQSIGLNYIMKYEEGKYYKSLDNMIDILVLEGTYREMGRQYGFLLNDELIEIHGKIKSHLTEQGWSEDSLNIYAKWLELNQPQQIKELIYGMSETSDLTKEEQFICSSFQHLFERPVGTTFTSWGEFTSKRPLMLAHNWDYTKDVLPEFTKYITLVIYKPKGIGNSTAEINFTGSVYFNFGINNRRLLLNIHDATLSDSIKMVNRIPVPYTAFSFMFDYSTIESVENPINSIQANQSVIINAADVNKSYSYQCATAGIQKRYGTEEGVIVSSNHFADPPPGWPVLELPANDMFNKWTSDRRENALSFATGNKPDLDIDLIKTYLSLDVAQGGVSFFNNQGYETLFQSIVVPVELELYLNIPGYSEWQKVNLKELFDL